MILSLDTNVLIELGNGSSVPVRRAYEVSLARGDVLMTSTFAAFELLYGAQVSARPFYQLRLCRGVLGGLSVAPWTIEDAEATAEIAGRLRRRGRTIGKIDVLIAGQALARGWTVVTANVGQFERMDGLNVIDWTRPTD